MKVEDNRKAAGRMEIFNITTGRTLANRARVADGFFSRLKGLLGTRGLAEGEGLIIRPCDSIHTFGMNYPIDVVFVAAADRVTKMIVCLGPGRMAVCRGSLYVVELPAGTLVRTGTMAGDRLRLECVE